MIGKCIHPDKFMEEQIDILNSKGEKTGKTLSYTETHKTGSIHRTVHVWFLNSKKQLLLQKRSKSKRAYPGAWDISVGGHISAGQTSLEAAKRETEEELGKTLPDEAFTLLFTVRQPRTEHKKDFIDEEFNDVYLVKYDADISDFSVQKDEVDEIRWINLDEFKRWIAGNGEPTVPHPEEYRLLLERLMKIYTEKTLKFAPDLVSKVLSGEKTSTWRLFDDKDLKLGDRLIFINKETGIEFGSAVITSLWIKTLGSLVPEDWIGHEKFSSEEEMYNTYRKYYGDKVDANTEVKIIGFEFNRYE